ncbi:MAG TPA: flagellar biosynthetic protein FliR [Thiobacillaceae bacterium]|nr:flagellar biosynthetic protein FliR [Thiobacillaceae bacterium]
MFTVSAEQINLYLTALLFPLVRVLAWLSTDPLLGNRSMPATVRVAFGFVLTVAIAPVLPPPPPVALLSGEGILILIQQVAIGVALGFTLRIVFATLEFAGQFMGLQMGLSYATLFDPVNGAQTPVVAQFLIVTAALVLLASNGHHLVLEALVNSFHEIPVAAAQPSGRGFAALARWGGVIFQTGLQIALPVTAALLSANLAIGMMSRAAPQLNIFAVGFPITLSAGMLMLYVTISFLPLILEQLWGGALQAAGGMIQTLAGP